MPRDDEFWNWQLHKEPFFAPAAGVGVRWTFLGHREWGFAPDCKFIVYRDGVLPWEMLRRRRDVSILAVENEPRGFHDIVPKLYRFGSEVKTFDSAWDFLHEVFDVPEDRMPELPELLKERYGEIAWHPYAPGLNPERRFVGDSMIETSELDGGLPLTSRWEIHHWRCECGRQLVGFQKHPYWEYHSDVHHPRCGCGKIAQTRES